MLKTRLHLLAAGFLAVMLVLAARLAQLQAARADYYRAAAEQAIALAPKALPFVRGSIVDRFGETLVSDRACWDLRIDYQAIAADRGGDSAAMRMLVRRLKRDGIYPHLRTRDELAGAFHEDMRRMWGDLTWFNSAAAIGSAVDFRDAADAIRERVGRIRQAVAARRGFDAPVAEEGLAHTLIADLSHEQQIRAREIFERYPWIHIEASSSREFAPGVTPFAHLLGRMAKVDAEDMAADSQIDNPFARYQADDLRGSSGVEWLAESTLRGRRGRLTLERDGSVLEHIVAEDGADARLTIHAGLQKRLYGLLEQAVAANSESSGGAIVILDVQTREALALVSYPSYDPAKFSRQFDTLRDDTDRLPLLFRAVGTRYAPGSTIKPLACLAGLIHGVIDLDSRENCTGYLFPDVRDRWRCWEVHGTGIRKAHGDVDLVAALTGSCNIFMYRLGERLGIDRLCGVFDMAGIGRGTGIGLREEDTGINPTPSWLMSNLGRSVTPGIPRQYAMGQGEVAMTPLQVANMMATYASGRWRPVQLLRDATPPPDWRLPGRQEHWQAIRRAIYGVTNDPEGTAYKYAHFAQDGYVLAGKTGSATAHPWPTAYMIPYRDEHGQPRSAIVREGAVGPALARFAAEYPEATIDREGVEVASRWPPAGPDSGENHSHAWFGGYLQPVYADGQPDFAREPRVAFAVLIEFGGSGGQTSGPLARQVAAELLATLGSALDPDHSRSEVAGP